MPKKEAMPLLDKHRSNLASRSLRSRKSGKGKGTYNAGFDVDLEEVVEEKEYWENDFDEEKILFADDKKRGTSLIWNDFIILSVEYLQWLAMIQSLALRWPWPENWIRRMSWLFAANLDVWEIVKSSSNVTYKSVQEFASDSSLMPFSYWHLLVAVVIFLLLLLLSYIISYIVLSRRDDPYMMVKISNMQRAFIIIIQLLALPIGMVIGKIFHCILDSKGEYLVMYVDNTQTCFADQQWAYAAAAIGIAIPFFPVFSAWLIRNTKLELIFSHASGHEAYLQLKETEFVQGLDVVYIVSGFHVFSSFKLKSAHFRAAWHILKLVVIVFYAALFNMSFIQAMVLTCVMFIYFVSFLIQRPFRVKLFNIVLVVNMFCLVLNLLTGALRTSFDVYSLRSVWFTPSYTTSMLIIVNGGWACFTLAVLFYLLLHQFNVFRNPIWPSLTSEGVEKLDEQTKKFMKGVLRARHVVERSMSLPPLFAPAHELSRQIQIINAYCREAELLEDPLQDTLWHLLDELIEVHAQIAPRSLFSESVKESIRTTASDLMRIMPMFVKRLAQREYDMLLVSPIKRRILLKIYCMGMFLNGRSKKTNMNKMNEAALHRVWNDRKHQSRHAVDYLGVLQPGTEMGPRVGGEYEPILQDAYSQDSLSLVTEDDASLDVDVMVAGIPSRSATRVSHHPSRPSSSAAIHRDSTLPLVREVTLRLPTLSNMERVPLPGPDDSGANAAAGELSASEHNAGTGETSASEHNAGTGETSASEHNTGTGETSASEHNAGTGETSASEHNAGTGETSASEHNAGAEASASDENAAGPSNTGQ